MGSEQFGDVARFVHKNCFAECHLEQSECVVGRSYEISRQARNDRGVPEMISVRQEDESSHRLRRSPLL